MHNIDRFTFDNSTPDKVSALKHDSKRIGDNWPIVYIINNDDEAYIGETLNAANRIRQHLTNEDRRRLNEIRIISDETFNKSAILDLEAYLIMHMSSERKYQLQNGNNGIQDHEYFQRSEYKITFEKIWNDLRKKGIVEKTVEEIENSELFKYSPYKSLGSEQMAAELEILQSLAAYKESPVGSTILVRGGAGTGKTILGVYLLKLFADIATTPPDVEIPHEEYFDDSAEFVYAAENVTGINKIGIVLPQTTLRSSLLDVLPRIRNLNADMILSPADVVSNYVATGQKYDLLIVDEAHRLKCRYKGHLSNYRTFDGACEALGMDKNTATELDWIMECSENQILFRDELQTVRPCDIDGTDFLRVIDENYARPRIELALNTQWRCQGGDDYIDYIRNILSCNQRGRRTIENYDVKMFNNVDEMIHAIRTLDEEYGLCRNVAGYAWKWASKRDKKAYDIFIDDYKYRWNSTYDNWINSKKAIDEIGCIHTVQGYDLNYVGVIIGPDIKYVDDPSAPSGGHIIADKNSYHDQQGKSGVANDPDALREYLTNIYLTLMTRGIKGTYIYVCDDGLREYMSQYFEVV